MKIKLLFLLLVTACFSCHQAEVKQAGTNSKLLGKWSVSETIQFQNNDDSISTKCNACPEIVFAGDETGSINGPDKQILNFTWQLDTTSLTIKHKGDSDIFIGDGTYQVQQNNVKSAREITLTDTVKDIKYILRK